MRQIVRLTEGDLHRIIRDCVNEGLSTIKEPSLKKGLNLNSDEEYEEYDDGGYYYKNRFNEVKHSGIYVKSLNNITSFGIDMVDKFFEKYQKCYQQLNDKEKEQFKTFICDGWAGNDAINFYA